MKKGEMGQTHTRQEEKFLARYFDCGMAEFQDAKIAGYS
jgi:hypothetical protein